MNKLRQTLSKLEQVNEVAFKSNYSQDVLRGKHEILSGARSKSPPKSITAKTTASLSGSSDPGKLKGELSRKTPAYLIVSRILSENTSRYMSNGQYHQKYSTKMAEMKIISTKQKLKENDVFTLKLPRRGTSPWVVMAVITSESELPTTKVGLIADIKGSHLDSESIDSREVEGPFYAVGAWGNPYRSNDNEFFFSGPKESRKDAQSFLKSRMKNGQPTKFRDWGEGPSKIFNSKEKARAYLKKQGINARYDDDDY